MNFYIYFIILKAKCVVEHKKKYQKSNIKFNFQAVVSPVLLNKSIYCLISQ